MTGTGAENIVEMPIITLDLSDDFKILSGRMGFRTLQDVIIVPPEILLQKRGFNYNWLGELISFLSDRGLLHLLQPLPGNNPG